MFVFMQLVRLRHGRELEGGRIGAEWAVCGGAAYNMGVTIEVETKRLRPNAPPATPELTPRLTPELC